MKKLGTDDVCELANRLFPDDGLLVTFNLMVEAANGLLEYEVINGQDEIITSDDSNIVAVLGLTSVGQGISKFSWVLDLAHLSQGVILMSMVHALPPVFLPKNTVDINRPPYTMAMLVACENIDGRIAYAIFRHPALNQHQARSALINSFPVEQEEPDDNSAPSGSN